MLLNIRFVLPDKRFLAEATAIQLHDFGRGHSVAVKASNIYFGLFFEIANIHTVEPAMVG